MVTVNAAELGSNLNPIWTVCGTIIQSIIS